MLNRIALSALLATCASTAMADYTLTILHTNDFHARFEPINKYDSTCKPEDNAEGKCFGGSARLATAIAEARARVENPVLLDGGDPFQGTLFYSHYKGQLAAQMMNFMGYEAMAVGNHEFDDGPEVLRRFVDAVEFPVLMANADISREPHLKGHIDKSIVIEKLGEKIGVIGLTPEDNHDLAAPGPNIIFTPAVDAVQDEVDKLTEQGIDKIIVLSHSGYTIDLMLARETTGVDVIVGGHSHTYLDANGQANVGSYPTMVGDTAVVQAYAFGKYLGELKVVFDDAGVVTSATGAPQLLDASVAENAEVVAMVARAAEPLNEIRNREVAEAVKPISGDSALCRAGECEMGNLVTDALLERVKDQGVEIAFMNGGGLRASIDQGPVTMGEVLTVLPFQNTLSTFRITGEAMVAALENGVGQVEKGAGRFPQVSGMSFAVDITAPAGSRISNVMVGDAPLDPEKLYFVASNNYIRNGGDGYKMFLEAQDAYDFGPDIADVLAEYLAAHSPYTPYTDGRIKVGLQ